MTNREAICKILGVDSLNDDFERALKESYTGDEPCEFALLQLSPRTPMYEAIEVEVGKQEQICGNLSVQMEATCAGDPRQLVSFCLETLRDCAKTVHKPDLLTEAYTRATVVMVLAMLWVQTWRIRLATVQHVQGVNRLISPFHDDNGNKLA